MKLYMHPISTTARAVRLFLADNNIKLDEETVDMGSGAHHKEPYASINPNRQVPFLVDGDLKMAESSAILKYLADVYDSPAYPKDLRKRAKINEMMDWLNTSFYRDYGYYLVYPQIFPHHKRENDAAQTSTLSRGQQGSNRWLKVLNDYYIGPTNNYLCGNEISIADYFGAAIITVGDTIGCDFSAYPNVKRWLDNMRALKCWNEVNQVFSGFVAANKDKEFVRLA